MSLRSNRVEERVDSVFVLRRIFLLVFLSFFYLVIAATYRRSETTELSGAARRTVREKFRATCKDFKRYC